MIKSVDPKNIRAELLKLADKTFCTYVDNALGVGAKLDSFPPHYIKLFAEKFDDGCVGLTANGLCVLDIRDIYEPSFFDIGLQLRHETAEPESVGFFLFIYGETVAKPNSTSINQMIFVYLVMDNSFVITAAYPIEHGILGPIFDLPSDFIPPQAHEILQGLTAEAH